MVLRMGKMPITFTLIFQGPGIHSKFQEFEEARGSPFMVWIVPVLCGIVQSLLKFSIRNCSYVWRLSRFYPRIHTRVLGV
jgi:hypothetical protein